MSELIKRLRGTYNASVDCRYTASEIMIRCDRGGCKCRDEDIETACVALEQAERLEREAFGAGLIAATNQFISVFDKAKDIDPQQAWLDYRGVSAGDSEPPAEHTCSLCGVVKPTAGDIDFEFRCNRKDCPGWQRFAPAHQSVPDRTPID